MSAGGVPDNGDAAEIEVVVARDGADVVDRLADVKVCARPPATGLAQPSVFNVPRRDSVVFESVGHRAEIVRSRRRTLTHPPWRGHRMGSEPSGRSVRIRLGRSRTDAMVWRSARTAASSYGSQSSNSLSPWGATVRVTQGIVRGASWCGVPESPFIIPTTATEPIHTRRKIVRRVLAEHVAGAMRRSSEPVEETRHGGRHADKPSSDCAVSRYPSRFAVSCQPHILSSANMLASRGGGHCRPKTSCWAHKTPGQRALGTRDSRWEPT